MNTQIVAVIFQEGGRLLSELIRSRPRQRPISIEPPLSVEDGEAPVLTEEIPTAEKKTGVATGCVACATAHLGTCSGLLAESLRFARQDGIESTEVIERVNLCIDEISVMERVDLRPEKMATLPEWEKRLADKALNESRSLRHSLEGLTSVGELEKTAARIQSARQELGREWFRQRLATMPQGEKAKLATKVIERLEKQ